MDGVDATAGVVVGQPLVDVEVLFEVALHWDADERRGGGGELHAGRQAALSTVRRRGLLRPLEAQEVRRPEDGVHALFARGEPRIGGLGANELWCTHADGLSVVLDRR